MGIYLYGFTPSDALPGPHLAGIGGDPVTGLSGPAFTLWVDGQETAPPATLESVRGHHAVVCAAWREAPACLPARFGQWFPDRAGLEETVRGIGPALERALANVRGADEHGLRVLDPEAGEGSGESTPAPPITGRDYLESLRKKSHALEAKGDRARALAHELEQALAGLVRAQKAEPLLTTRHGLLSVSHLVAREREEDYAERLAVFRDGHPELRFLVTGPWPPYSFAP